MHQRAIPWILRTCLLAMAAPASSLAQTTTYTIPNFSFEAGTISFAESWEPIGTTDVQDGVFPKGTNSDITSNNPPSDGVQLGYLSSGFGAGSTALFRQTLSATYTQGTQYMMTVALARRGPTATSLTGQLALEFRLPNDTLLASTIVNANQVIASSLTDFTVSYTAQAADDGQAIRLSLDPVGNGNGDWSLDNVRLESVVIPEPGGLAILGLAATCLLRPSWRSRRRLRLGGRPISNVGTT